MSKPIKIMRIIARLNVGGPAIHVSLLTQRLGAPDFTSLLVCGEIEEHEGDMKYLAESLGVQPHIIPHLGRSISPLRDMVVVIRLIALMLRFRPDVVHTHTAKAGVVGRLAAWVARVPVRIHTFHGHVFRGYFGARQTQFFLWLERLCARLSTRVVTISPNLCNELVNIYKIAPAEKFVVVPLGLNLQPFVDAAQTGQLREKFNLPANKKLVGIVGRLVPIKNHSLFLEAARQVLAQRQDVHFVIIGDGECRPAIEQAIQDMGLATSVSLVGWVTWMEEALKELDVLALTSDNEGTPVSIIEALAAGVPVVATAVGGVPDVLDNGRLGHIAPPNDSQAFAQALLRVLNGDYPDPELGRQAVLSRYSIDRLVQDLASLYRNLLTAQP